MSADEANKAFFEESFQYWQKMYHIAYSMMGSSEEAEDAVQDTLIKAASKQKQFQGKSSLYTWLVRILINHCNDLHRKRKRRATSSLTGEEKEYDVPDERQNVQKKIELSEASTRLIDMLQKLSPIYKDVVVLRYFEEMSYADIAGCLEISEGTVKSRLNNARRILKSELEALGIGEEYLAL